MFLKELLVILIKFGENNVLGPISIYIYNAKCAFSGTSVASERLIKGHCIIQGHFKGPRLINWLKNYFEDPVPLHKLGHISVPVLFARPQTLIGGFTDN